jgi:polyisoprenoid-binding protein YceI
MFAFSLRPTALYASVLILAACGGEAPPTTTAAPTPAPTATPAFELKAPAGEYKMDPNHAGLAFKLKHMGLADYNARFTRFDVALTLDPQNLANSSVAVTVDPTSVRTDYMGNFKATHEGSPYGSFEERISREDKFFNSDQFPSMAFKSTKVEPLGAGKLRVTGDLTFLGQTHPVTLDAAVTGSMDKHPMSGRGAIGFTAKGTLIRSEWGMTGTQQFVGDAVTILFDGEFQQPEPAAPAPPTS